MTIFATRIQNSFPISHPMFPIRFLTLLSIALLLGSCAKEDAPEPAKPAPGDSAGRIILLPMQGERRQGYDSANADNFHRVVYMEYARLGVQLPKRVADSIFRSTPMEQIESAMTARIRRQDTVARSMLAVKYSISIDSIDAILAIGRQEEGK